MFISDQPMSVTQSYGSIKLFKAARHHSKAAEGPMIRDSEDEEDEDRDEDFGSDDDTGQKRRQKHKGMS